MHYLVPLEIIVLHHHAHLSVRPSRDLDTTSPATRRPLPTAAAPRISGASQPAAYTTSPGTRASYSARPDTPPRRGRGFAVSFRPWPGGGAGSGRVWDAGLLERGGAFPPGQGGAIADVGGPPPRPAGRPWSLVNQRSGECGPAPGRCVGAGLFGEGLSSRGPLSPRGFRRGASPLSFAGWGAGVLGRGTSPKRAANGRENAYIFGRVFARAD